MGHSVAFLSGRSADRVYLLQAWIGKYPLRADPVENLSETVQEVTHLEFRASSEEALEKVPHLFHISDPNPCKYGPELAAVKLRIYGL